MAAPNRLLPERLFRPTGNSQPINLVQYLAREKPAKVLSLGCGDIRNILFTAYCDADNNRHLDITCCDVEAAVIARNILLLSILIDDDATGKNNDLLFKLAFDMVIDEAAFSMLRKQGKKLRQRARSLEKWHNSMYGKVIRFCDSESLAQVLRIWECYSMSSASDISRFNEVKEGSSRIGRPGVSVEMAEAFAPFLVTLKNELRDFHEKYWNTGMVDYDTDTKGKKLYWNPTYSFQSDGIIVHPGTCPLEGFNLALGYAPFDNSSPLVGADNAIKSVERSIESMKIQFRAWGNAFGRCYRRANITLRFAVSDALAFCHTLAARSPYNPTMDSLSRGPATIKTMNLDGPDYTNYRPFSPEAYYHAPTVFNTIDTSSLVDKCGALNILLATSSLIQGSMESSLITEMSWMEYQSLPDTVGPILQGDFMTLMMLIGLSPVEYLSNNTSTPTCNKSFLKTIQKRLGEESPVVKMRICWKVCCRIGCMPIDGQGIFRGLQHLPHQLGKLLYRTYCRMFRKEEKKHGALQCTPATFALLLQKIKLDEADRWPTIMASTIDNFRTDPDNELCDKDKELEADKGPNGPDQDFDEMLVQLQRFDVYDLVDSLPLTGQPRTKTAHASHVTLAVSRELLEFPPEIDLAKVGGLLSVVVTVGARGQIAKRFSVLSMTFGLIMPSATQFGKRNRRLEIYEDPSGWVGSSPFLVSFSAPPSLITDQELEVTLAFKKTPQADEICGSSLGPELIIFRTFPGKADDYVFVCDEAPVVHVPQTQDVKTSGGPQPTLQNVPDQGSLPFVPPSGPVPAKQQNIDEALPPREPQANIGENHQAAEPPANVERADSVISWDSDEMLVTQPESHFVDCSIKPSLSDASSSLQALMARIEVHSEDWKIGIQNGGKFFAQRVTPCSFSIKMEGSPRSLVFAFPFPVEEMVVVGFPPDGSVLVLTAGPSHPAGENFPMMQSSFVLFEQIAILGHPYLPLDRLPAFDQSQLGEFDELRNLLKHMQSEREAELQRYMIRSEEGLVQKELRSGFKQGLTELFRLFCGIDCKKDRRKNLFLFTTADRGDQFFVSISAMRLDMGNQSFVLDAAVIPVTRSNKTRLRRMYEKANPSNTEVYSLLPEEVLPWKSLLTTAVERARTWSHRPDCEYKMTGKMPLSMSNHINFLCSCGNGKLPANFVKNPPAGWDHLKDMAVRVAVSPSYSSMMVEPQIPWRLFPKSYGPADLGAPRYVPKCFECGKELGDGKPKRCGRCGTATYCSTECHTANWKKHKDACGHYEAVRASMGTGSG